VLALVGMIIYSCAYESKENTPTPEDIVTETAEVKISEKRPSAFESAMKSVDDIPLFGGCVTKECSDKKLMEYVLQNLKYPEIARSEIIEGKVFIQFIVETDGSVSNTYIARDIGGGCGQAARELVDNMNKSDLKWRPGRHNGEEVKVMLTLPITYTLEV